MSTLRTASIGGVTFDLFLELKDTETISRDEPKQFELPIGAKVPVKHVHERYGGGACNTSVGFATLGATAHFVGVLASDQWGKAMQQNFAAKGVHTNSSTIVEGETSSFSIILQANSKDRTILYTPGSNVHLHDAILDTEVLSQVDCIYFNHIQRHSQVIQDDLVRIVREHKPLFAWNPGGYHIDLGHTATESAELLKLTTVLQLNKEEAQAFTGTDSATEALHALSTTGAKYICITDGSNGTIALDTQAATAYQCATVPVEVLDATGAGDAFGTASTWAIASGLSLPEALQAGSINAASVIQQIGAQPGLLTDIELRQQLQSNPPSVSELSFA